MPMSGFSVKCVSSSLMSFRAQQASPTTFLFLCASANQSKQSGGQSRVCRPSARLLHRRGMACTPPAKFCSEVLRGTTPPGLELRALQSGGWFNLVVGLGSSTRHFLRDALVKVGPVNLGALRAGAIPLHPATVGDETECHCQSTAIP